MTGIRRLSDATIRRIAAGEVVERPASVVKELLENSLDAGADRVAVEVDRGGKDRIRVADDGAGMARGDLVLAVEEHTTSKLRDADELADGVASLGFRGEALHAIGAVSAMSITTRPRDDPAGAASRLRVTHGEVGTPEPAGRAPGTTVEVTDLFAETPARAKFLKTDATEFDRVTGIVTRYALANPDVAVSLDHDGREVFATPGDGELTSAILAVYGREVASSMIDLPAGGDVSGAVNHPETTRSTRDYLSTYVNGRYVPAPVLREAVVGAYGGQLATDRYPFAVVFLDLPPGKVDVNVHPRKLEVRFDDPAAVRTRVRDAVEAALLDHGLIRSSAPRGRSRPEEVAVAPERTDDGETAERSGSPPGGPADAPAGSGSESAESGSGSDTAAPTGGAGDSGGGGDVEAASDPVARRSDPPVDPTADSAPEPDRDGPDPHDRFDRRPASDGPATAPATPADRKFRGTDTQATLDEGTVDETLEFDRLPPMRVLGQLRDTYLVAASGDGLLLIDQHAADERVNYERLCERVAGDAGAQTLAEPVEVELTAREMAAFPAHEEALESVGFRARRVDGRTIAVDAVPAVLGDALPPDLVRDVLSERLGGDREETSVDRRADSLLADLACYPSITGNTPLTAGSTRRLLRELDRCENPYACPHGRPVVIEFGGEEIDDRFERDYPGHGHRRRE